MREKTQKRDFVFIKGISDAPMTQAEWDTAEDLFAKLIARAIFTEHQQESGEGTELNNKGGY